MKLRCGGGGEIRVRTLLYTIGEPTSTFLRSNLKKKWVKGGVLIR